ncbi:MAG: 50S ribosomal protein L4 [Ardenticatenaceae bacterium]|nr:50S ribosomal protein L4 [Ardenticatenaceae bacterium]
MKVPVYNMQGEQVREVELAPSIFEIEPNISVMHQALVRQQANARAGTHSTKTRAEVSRSGSKVWRQKGTGRARQGSRRAPHWVGGGIVFGPKPRDYSKKMPRKMRQLAIRSALAAKARANRLIVIDELRFERPKTKEMANVLEAVGVGNRSAVVLYNGAEDENVKRSADNLAQVMPLHWQYLNMRDVLGHDYLVVPLAALDRIQALWG